MKKKKQLKNTLDCGTKITNKIQISLNFAYLKTGNPDASSNVDDVSCVDVWGRWHCQREPLYKYPRTCLRNRFISIRLQGRVGSQIDVGSYQYYI